MLVYHGEYAQWKRRVGTRARHDQAEMSLSRQFSAQVGVLMEVREKAARRPSVSAPGH